MTGAKHLPPAQTPAPANDSDRGELLRKIAAIVGNVGVFTALLVYFGWVRSEVQAKALGIDESILDMSTRDYLLRSVRPVLVLLIVVAAGALLWVLLDHVLSARLARHGTDDRIHRWAVRLLPAAIIVLPLVGWLARYRWPAVAYIAFPLLCAAGLLLLLYSFRLRAGRPGSLPLSSTGGALLRAGTAVLIGVALFSTASNYATVEGTELARNFEAQVPLLPSVVVHSTSELNLDAPGVLSTRSGDKGYAFRYDGLRLLEHVGGHYFLIPDGWSREFGVVIALKDSEPGVRFDFIRDNR